MPRTLPAAGLAGVLDQDTPQAYLALLEIAHDGDESPWRICNNSTNVVYGGITYFAYPFNIILPTNEQEKIPTAQLTIDNVDRFIIGQLRSQSGPMTCNIKVVASEDLEAGLYCAMWVDMEIRTVEYNISSITARLTNENYLAEPFPKDIMNQRLFPGLFGRGVSGSYTPPPVDPDTDPPTVPQNLNGVASSDTEISLTWDASTDEESGVFGYNIYRDTVLIGSVITNQYQDVGLVPSTEYTYAVSAVDNATNESTQSTPTDVTTNDFIGEPIYTDFSQYLDGQTPSDWTNEFTTPAGMTSFEGLDNGGAVGGRVIRHAFLASGAYGGMSWDMAGMAADVEILTKGYWSDSGVGLPNSIWFRVTGQWNNDSSNDHEFYGVHVAISKLYGLVHVKYSPTPVTTNLQTVTLPAMVISPGDPYWMRARANGTTLYFSAWTGTFGAEPGAWSYEIDITTLDPSLQIYNGGRLGLYNSIPGSPSGGNVYDFDEYAVAYNGETAVFE